MVSPPLIFIIRKRPKMKNLIIVSASLIFLSSCVTQQQFEELTAAHDECQTSLEAKKYEVEQLRVELKNLTELNQTLDLNNRELTERVAKRDLEIMDMVALQAQINEMHKRLSEDYEKLLKNCSSSTANMTEIIEEQKRQLEQKKKELIVREDNITKLQDDLRRREARVKELEDIIARQNQVVEDLKNKINKALIGFQSNELSVETRNGRVYVSLSEKLLFKSGSAVVDAKGVDAISKLSAVLVANPDIEIQIEGHTDTDAFTKATAPKDNWDLSVLRATAIVRILQDEGVNPGRITASGRSEYIPVAPNDSKENKALNRRTEIILSPNLDELMNLLKTE